MSKPQGADLRVCFVGDSFVAGVGDETHAGWVGRLVSASRSQWHRLTAYNLGVRGDTSALIARRVAAECAARLTPGGFTPGVVLSFGVNDVIVRGGAPRVAEEERLPNLCSILDALEDAGTPVLVVGPPAIADEELNEQISLLDRQLRAECRRRGVPYVSVMARLREDALWRAEVAADDGAHPRRAGYTVLASLIRPTWEAWLAGLTEGRGPGEAPDRRSRGDVQLPYNI